MTCSGCIFAVLAFCILFVLAVGVFLNLQISFWGLLFYIAVGIIILGGFKMLWDIFF